MGLLSAIEQLGFKKKEGSLVTPKAPSKSSRAEGSQKIWCLPLTMKGGAPRGVPLIAEGHCF